MFEIKKINGKTVYYSTLLDVEHFFTSRELQIKENIEAVSSYLQIPSKNFIKPIQTHSDNIEIVKENKIEYPSCDSLILNKKNYAIYLNFADCTPIVFYDFKNEIASIAHAGWRGTVQKIGPKTIFEMQKYFNTNPKDVIALIGPAISFKHFETSYEIIEKLKMTINDVQKYFSNTHADLKGINAQQLIEIGVKNIDICPYCTVEDNDKFYSYRKENKTNLRHSAVIKL